MQRTVLARRVGAAENTIYRIETGKRTPSVELLEKIARELRTEPAEFLREPVPLAEAPQESGPPQVSREDLEKLEIPITDPELKELNNELASYWHLWVHKDKTAYAYISEEDVDTARIKMLIHLVLGTPSIVAPEAAGVVREGIREKLKTG